MPVIDASEYTRKVLGSALVKDQVNRIVNGPRQNNVFTAVQFRSKLINKVTK